MKNLKSTIHALQQKEERIDFILAWLQSTFYVGESGSLLKSTVYKEYVRMCQRRGWTPTSAAAFGKFVRKAFPNITSNRRGPRGGAKHHYRLLNYISSEKNRQKLVPDSELDDEEAHNDYHNDGPPDKPLEHSHHTHHTHHHPVHDIKQQQQLLDYPGQTSRPLLVSAILKEDSSHLQWRHPDWMHGGAARNGVGYQHPGNPSPPSYAAAPAMYHPHPAPAETRRASLGYMGGSQEKMFGTRPSLDPIGPDMDRPWNYFLQSSSFTESSHHHEEEVAPREASTPSSTPPGDNVMHAPGESITELRKGYLNYYWALLDSLLYKQGEHVKMEINHFWTKVFPRQYAPLLGFKEFRDSIVDWDKEGLNYLLEQLFADAEQMNPVELSESLKTVSCYLPVWVQSAASLVIPKDLLIRQMGLWNQFSQALFKRAHMLTSSRPPTDLGARNDDSSSRDSTSAGLESEELLPSSLPIG